MKRKDPPTTQASPAKTPRHREEQGEVEEDGRSWDMKAGMILEVKLRNFMCHEVRGLMKYAGLVITCILLF
jgi:hypothetical protein